MIQYCHEHNDVLTSICTAKHKCNVKLCATCFYKNHNGISQSEIYPFEIFQTECAKKFFELINEMNWTTYYKEKTEIKEMIGDMEKQFQNLISGLRNQVESIFKQLDAQCDIYQELNQQIQNHQIRDFSKEELLKIISLFQKESFDLAKERKNNIEKAQKLKENFKKVYVKFEQEIKSDVFNQPDANKQKKKIKIQEMPQSNNKDNQNHKQQIFGNLQQAIKYQFKDDPTNSIIHFTLIKLISEIYSASKIQISLQQTANLNQQFKDDIEKTKLETIQIFNKFVSSQIPPGIRKDYKIFFDFFVETLQLTNLSQLQSWELILDQHDLIYPIRFNYDQLQYEQMIKIANMVLKRTQDQIQLNLSPDKEVKRFQSQQQNRNSEKKQPQFLSQF